MTSPIKFGTDGWRAIIAEDYTFDNVRICAQAVARFLLDTAGPKPSLVVGYDTRFNSEHFAAATAEVTAANGVKTYICNKAAPTPVVSYSILDRHASGAVVITASHNPSIYNGFKYKPEYAGSASPEVVAKLESRIDNVFAGQDKVKRLRFEDALAQGVVEYIDPDPAYFAQLARLVDLETIRSAGLKIAVDSMYGAGAGYFRRLLGGAATQIIEIHSERNPLFPGLSPEPIARNLGALSEAVRANGAAVGLATDGDSDRIGIVDEHGNYVTQLQVFALLALYLLEVRGDRGALVKSLTTTSMAYRLGELFGVPVIETAVGFKYVGPQMIKHNALLGGEESGGFGFRGHIPERDALVAGLYFLDLMIKMKRTPSQLIEYLYSKVGPHYYDRVDIEFPPEKRQAMVDRLTSTTPASIDGTAVKSIDRIDGFRFVLEDGSWLLIRFSGTEPILRIYTETTSPERVKELLEEGKRLAGF